MQYIYSLAFMKGFKLQEIPPALEREHPALQTKIYSLFFLYAFLDPDSQFGSGSTDPVDPDPDRNPSIQLIRVPSIPLVKNLNIL